MRVRRLSRKLIGFQTIVMRELVRVLRIWVQTLVPPAITATLYFIIFGRTHRQPRRADGRLQLHGLHCPGPDHDGGHHQRLRQRGVVVLRRQVRPPHGGAAGLAAAQQPTSSWATWPAACYAACWWVSLSPSSRCSSPACMWSHPFITISWRCCCVDGVRPGWLHQRSVRQEIRRCDHQSLLSSSHRSPTSAACSTPSTCCRISGNTSPEPTPSSTW